MAPHSPNLASLGRLILIDKYKMAWDDETGLRLWNADWELVPTYVHNFVPYLGEDRRMPRGLSFLVGECVDTLVDTLDRVIEEVVTQVKKINIFMRCVILFFDLPYYFFLVKGWVRPLPPLGLRSFPPALVGASTSP